MADRYFLLLPALREDSQTRPSTPDTPGCWDFRYDRTELDRVSDALDVQEVDPKYIEVDSIPDVWARPLLFEMALLDKEHPLHKRIRGEWRGLLALLALRELRGLKGLEVIRVSLPQKRDGAGDVSEPYKAAPSFLRALSELVPTRSAGESEREEDETAVRERSISDDVSWRDVRLFRLGQHIIGLTSPVTIVCTPVDYYGALQSHQVGWFNGRYLEDPKVHLNSDERRRLAQWVRAVAAKVANHPKQPGEQERLSEALKGQLDEFADHLGPGAELLREDDVVATKDGYRFMGLLEAISRPLKAAAADPGHSHVRLVPSRPMSPAVALLVLSLDVAEQWGERPEDVLVIGAKPLSAVVPYGGLADVARRDQLGSDPLIGAEWRKPEEFFTDTLHVVTQKEAFLNSEKPEGIGSLLFNNQPVTALIPIKRELLDYLEPQDLARRVSFHGDKQGITVRLTLPLAGSVGVSRDYVVEKRYAVEHVREYDNVPVLEVWPNFEASRWRTYFTYYSTREEQTFNARPYRHEFPNPGGKEFKNRRGEVERAVYVTESFPEAIICSSGGASTPEEAAGLIILEPPNSVAPSATWEIGVDFGTTATNVYFRPEGGDAKPMCFEDRFLRITNAPERARPRLAEDFMPGERVDAPFLSVYRDFAEPEDPQRPLLDGHILYILEGTYASFDPSEVEISTDLKWSKRPEDRKRAVAFLTQLCLQCAAEAVAGKAARVRWRYSYPTAFGTKHRLGLPKQWEDIVQLVSGWTGLDLKEVEAPRGRTESEAAALFFREKHGASPAAGAVYIDIGGGTTDVAVWQNQEPLWQTSLRFAGRDLFLEPLRRGLGATSALFEGLEGDGHDQRDYYAAADAYLMRRERDVMRRLLEHAGTPEVGALVQHIALGLGGIVYYVGLVLKRLAAERRYRPEVPGVYVGGNGSKLFHWLDAGHFHAGSDMNRLFQRVFAASSGLDREGDLFQLVLSDLPKAEAAHGLVSRHTLGASSERGTVVWSGESFREGGIEQHWEEPLTPERLHEGIEPPDRFAQLEGYLSEFNAYASLPGAPVAKVQVSGRTTHAIKHRLSNTLQDYRGQEVEDIEVEPLFILALKAFLEVRLGGGNA